MTHAALHPQAQAFLEQAAASGAPALHTLTVPEARAAASESAALLGGPPPAVHTVTDLVAGGPAGPIPIRAYHPQPNSGQNPAVIWFHGGGWVVGSLESYDVLCRRLAIASGGVVLSVDYRLAPEHPFPAPVDDAAAATEWVLAHAGELEIDASRVAVGGDSAGAALAAVAARRARDADSAWGPPLVGQLLVYPVMDAAMDTDSYTRFSDGYHLTAEGMRWYWDCYCPDPVDRLHPEASPLRVGDLARLPPAAVIVASHDPLRDEGLAYAERLATADVPVTVVEVAGQIHGFIRWTAVMDDAARTIDDAAGMLRTWWASSGA